MQIIWYGQSLFEIIAIPKKNSQVKIVIDPFDESLGLKIPKLEADILLVTHSHCDHNNIKSIIGNPFLINNPGEYEVKNAIIQGIPSFHDNSRGQERGENTIYTIEVEDLKICHLGDLGQRELTEEQLEKIGEVDILMIPVGGTYTISSKEAPKIMSQIEPKITIPMHYSLPTHFMGTRKIHPVKSREGVSSLTKSFNRVKLDSVDKFLKVFGIRSLTPAKKLSIKKKDLSPEEAKIIILTP